MSPILSIHHPASQPVTRGQNFGEPQALTNSLRSCVHIRRARQTEPAKNPIEKLGFWYLGAPMPDLRAFFRTSLCRARLRLARYTTKYIPLSALTGGSIAVWLHPAKAPEAHR